MFAIALLGILGRFYIRLRIHKQFSIDDGILILGTCCLISSLGMTFSEIDYMYTVEALTLGEMTISQLPPAYPDRVIYYRKMNNASLILTWLTIVSIKFSFLALFKKLIDRIRPLVVYWWIIAVFNGAVAIYGATVPILACPALSSTESGKSIRTCPTTRGGR